MFVKDSIDQPNEGGVKLDAEYFYQAHLPALCKGRVIFDLRDAETGEVIEYWEKDNIVTRDAGILAAIRFSESGTRNPLNMLAVGTGATGALLSPDAPQNTQRALNTEIERKPFSNVQYRDSDGNAVAIPTNIVDYTTVYSEGEAVGPLNEMGLMSTISNNVAVRYPILNGPTGYDATIDVTSSDIIANYLTFSVVSKPSSAVLGITWRITF